MIGTHKRLATSLSYKVDDSNISNGVLTVTYLGAQKGCYCPIEELRRLYDTWTRNNIFSSGVVIHLHINHGKSPVVTKYLETKLTQHSLQTIVTIQYTPNSQLYEIPDYYEFIFSYFSSIDESSLNMTTITNLNVAAQEMDLLIRELTDQLEITL